MSVDFCGFVEGGFKYNGRVYKSPKKTEYGYVSILANSRWNYFMLNEHLGMYVKFADTLRYDKKMEP